MKILIAAVIGLVLTACTSGTETAAQLSAQVIRAEAERDQALAEAAYWKEQTLILDAQWITLVQGIYICEPMGFPDWCIDQYMAEAWADG